MRLHQIGNGCRRSGRDSRSYPQRGLALVQTANRVGARRTAFAGFSIVELVVSLCVMMILTAIAIPSLMRSLRTYQLNDAATRLAAMLKFTRFEAVRRNTQVNFLMTSSGNGYQVGTDSNGNNALDATEKQELIAGFATILSSGTAPAPTAITNALSGATLTPVYGSTSAPVTLTFDARGAIRVGGTVSSKIFVFYIGSTVDPDPGYRAVILLPSGSTQIWTSPSSATAGPWQKVG